MTEDWQTAAACRGLSTDLFFSERGDNREIAHAKAVCAKCRVREDCLEFAIASGERLGIWGGLSPKQRQKIRRRQRMEAA
jgi:WhiB family transcriptional regulator, redox-sensing transcriptional regulator